MSSSTTLAANQVALASPSSSAEEAEFTPPSVQNADEIYKSYVAAMGAPSPSSDAQPSITLSFIVAAVQPVETTSTDSSDSTSEETVLSSESAQGGAIYSDYIAGMAAPTTGAWATYSTV